MSGPLMVFERDADGLVSSIGFVVAPCASEPAETFERIAQARAEGRYEPYSHGIAVMVARNGCDEPLAFCGPCGERWRAETERLARLRRLPPTMRDWLAARGVSDPADLTAPLEPAPELHVGDIVQLHEVGAINADFSVVAVHRNGRVTLALDVEDRTITKTAMARDCRVVGRQMALMD